MKGTTGTRSPICVWDTTVSCESHTVDSLKKLFTEHCKKWCFQKEKGAKTGYEHFQCRVSLKLKTRMPTMAGIHPDAWSPTSDENKKNDFYVMKSDTRIDGPWKDDDEEVYIPRQYRNITLRPWQTKVIEMSKQFDDRHINVIFDPKGNHGKSLLASYCALFHNGIDLPPINDSKQLMEAMYGVCSSRKIRQCGPVFVDLPRALDKSRLYGLFSAIEMIKKGQLIDLRYAYKEWWIDSPNLWIITNYNPEEWSNLLSSDRWRIYTFDDSNNLIKYTPPNPVRLITEDLTSAELLALDD
jgi:hypothetical protein